MLCLTYPESHVWLVGLKIKTKNKKKLQMKKNKALIRRWIL